MGLGRTARLPARQVHELQQPPGGMCNAALFASASSGGGHLLRLQGGLPLGLARLHVGRPQRYRPPGAVDHPPAEVLP
eukprot:2211374-Alexandrium_andersonii.AAC.1